MCMAARKWRRQKGFGPACPGSRTPFRAGPFVFFPVTPKAVVLPATPRRRAGEKPCQLRRRLLLVAALAAVVPRRLHAVGQELAIERRGVDAQDLRGFLLLPLRVVQHLEDVLALQLLE